MPTNKKFGYFFTIVFMFFSIYFFMIDSNLHILFEILTIIIIALTLFFPNYLYPFNFIWYKFGLFLGKIISPIVLGIIFFLIITPTAIITKIFGRDELRLKKKYSSYWKNDQIKIKTPKSFKDQF